MCLEPLFSMLELEINLTHPGIHNQLTNCHIFINLASRDLFKA